MRPPSNALACLALSVIANLGCLEQCVTPPLQPARRAAREEGVENVDVLFVIDNSASMAQNQSALTRAFGALVEQLVNPPLNAATGRPSHLPVKSLHVGVITTDLGTPGSVVPACANSDSGDDGLLNPIRNGLATRTHQPWTSAPEGARPSRCTNAPTQYPSFLRFDATFGSVADLRDDFACNAYLSTGGCGLEQQLEAAYRALVIHNPREQPGNTDANAGFVRDNAVLSIVVLSDEEDGSTRDCRYAEQGITCTDALSVYDIGADGWASNDLNLRFYAYAPGGEQDPTWPVDRYFDPMRARRGFTSLKPDHPERVTFSAITGVPLEIPMRTSTVTGERTVDWEALLGRNAAGSDGYVGEQSGSGAISMRQANLDPMCPTRVVPACRREASPSTTSCVAGDQYFAWPARRIAEVARRFDERYQSGSVSSICANDLTPAITQIAELVQSRLYASCLPAWFSTTPAICTGAQTPSENHCAVAGTPVRLDCVLRELLPMGVSAASVCTRARGRTVGARDVVTGREVCVVDQVIAPLGGVPASGARGFWYDTRNDPLSFGCRRSVRFTEGAESSDGAIPILECVDPTAPPIVTGSSGSCG